MGTSRQFRQKGAWESGTCTDFLKPAAWFMDSRSLMAEVYLENGRNMRIEVRNGEIETVQEAASHGVGFRVFVGGRMAFSSCNDFSDSAFEDAIEKAIGFAGNTTADENNVLPDDKGMTDVPGLYDPQIHEVPMDRRFISRRFGTEAKN